MDLIEKFKQRYLEVRRLARTTPIFHGTNSKSFESITNDGIRIDSTSNKKVDIRKIAELLRESGIDWTDRLSSKEDMTYLTPIYQTAIGYAQDSPEFLSWYTWLGSSNKDKLPIINHDKYAQAQDLYKTLRSHYSGSSPVVIHVNPLSESLRGKNQILDTEDKELEEICKTLESLPEERKHMALELVRDNEVVRMNGWERIMVGTNKTIPAKDILKVDYI